MTRIRSKYAKFKISHQEGTNGSNKTIRADLLKMEKKLDLIRNSINDQTKLILELNDRNNQGSEELNTIKLALKNFIASSLEANEDITAKEISN